MATVAENVSACTFRYTPGTAQRSGLVSLELAVAEDGERVSLLRQLHVENAP